MHLVIAGLGNPGKKYANTRHNLGAMVVETFGYKENLSFKEEKEFSSLVAKASVKRDEEVLKVHLLLPQTYMNLSGVAISRYLNFYKLAPSHLIVVCDDIALTFGMLRIRNVGGDGGHNGLKNIEAHLHTKHYVRLRMGIGRDEEVLKEEQQSLADYVLDQFTKEENEKLIPLLEQGVAVLKRLIFEPVTVVMNAVNAKQKKS